ncbi:N-glycosidase R617 (Riboflavin biosynthesis intermediates N-glycosidase) [Durusdinium trenchii]|uniref:N-glycosidase R617 (Riboflavin biosynthesis intermediates N-glycosidase) n=1 Tax=Durusdinium trenchii TaxID=1381693 RepID=A0ABP0H889_9DINO
MAREDYIATVPTAVVVQDTDTVEDLLRDDRVQVQIVGEGGLRAGVTIGKSIDIGELRAVCKEALGLKKATWFYEVFEGKTKALGQGSKVGVGALILASRKANPRLPAKAKAKAKAKHLETEPPGSKTSIILPFFESRCVFSQFNASEFVDPFDGVTYSCCEQFMMAKKALLFGDETSLKIIMSATKPGEMKRQGRKVAKFDDKVWIRQRLAIVTRGNLLKFSQNDNCKDELLRTGDRILVEACHDAIWGSGKPRTSRFVFDQSKWGLNLLGLALMAVREILTDKGAGFDFFTTLPHLKINTKAQGDVYRTMAKLDEIKRTSAVHLGQV